MNTTAVSHFAPAVLIDGRTVEPAGWMWVLGFALGGVPWAIAEASTPAFRACVADELRVMRNAETEAEIAALERRIALLRGTLKGV